ncbi:MAG TPA: hypothetical protein VGS12_18570 [Caulobacteraceae bacterium]|nr:hypothetical protein [Caulobacteraceae bacterium]
MKTFAKAAAMVAIVAAPLASPTAALAHGHWGGGGGGFGGGAAPESGGRGPSAPMSAGPGGFQHGSPFVRSPTATRFGAAGARFGSSGASGWHGWHGRHGFHDDDDFGFFGLGLAFGLTAWPWYWDYPGWADWYGPVGYAYSYDEPVYDDGDYDLGPATGEAAASPQACGEWVWRADAKQYQWRLEPCAPAAAPAPAPATVPAR